MIGEHAPARPGRAVRRRDEELAEHRPGAEAPLDCLGEVPLRPPAALGLHVRPEHAVQQVARAVVGEAPRELGRLGEVAVRRELGERRLGPVQPLQRAAVVLGVVHAQDLLAEVRCERVVGVGQVRQDVLSPRGALLVLSHGIARQRCKRSRASHAEESTS